MVAKKAVRILLTFAGLLPYMPLWAQWHDSFENGLEAWHGSREYFIADSAWLQSRGPEKKSVLSLSRAFNSGRSEDLNYRLGLERGDSSLCFEFGISLQFVPSSTNTLRLYLMGSDSVWSDTATVLYLHLGQKGGDNRWQFFYQSKDTSFMLWEGERLYTKQSQMDFKLRAVYIADSSCWRFYHAEPLSSVWEQEGGSLWAGRSVADFFKETAIDRQVMFYSGIMASYQTASRFDKYAFTYMQAGRLPEPNPAGIVARFVGEASGMAGDTICLCYPPSAGSLAINEVLFEPRTGQSRFVEITNPMDSVFCTANLALGVLGDKGWKYSRLRKDHFLWMPPGDYKAFAKDAESIAPDYRQEKANILTAAAFPTLNEKGERLRLVWLPPEKETGDTIIVDEVYYSRDFHHWLLSETKGVSLERLDERKPALTQENWASAAETAGYATPGCPNSHRRLARSETEPKYFVLEPQVVTPNNDGKNDFLYVRWKAALAGCVCSITVYDSYGRKIRSLCQELLLGAEGEIRYDATDASGRVLRPGIYVLYIDLVRANKHHKRLRYAFAVG